MNANIDKLAKENNGLISYSRLIENGFYKSKINYMVESDIIHKVAHGWYYHKDYEVDNMFLLQSQNNTVIFSHETAAYLYNLTDRFPRKYSVTVKQGTNFRNRNNYNVFYVQAENYDLGKNTLVNSLGNEIILYDLERTVCDIIRSEDRIELQVYLEVLKNYFKKNPNTTKLSKYAKHFGITQKIYELSLLLLES